MCVLYHKSLVLFHGYSPCCCWLWGTDHPLVWWWCLMIPSSLCCVPSELEMQVHCVRGQEGGRNHFVVSGFLESSYSCLFFSFYWSSHTWNEFCFQDVFSASFIRVFMFAWWLLMWWLVIVDAWIWWEEYIWFFIFHC